MPHKPKTQRRSKLKIFYGKNHALIDKSNSAKLNQSFDDGFFGKKSSRFGQKRKRIFDKPKKFTFMNNKKPKPKKKINLQNELKLLSQTFDL